MTLQYVFGCKKSKTIFTVNTYFTMRKKAISQDMFCVEPFPLPNPGSKKSFLKGWEEGFEELLGISVNHMLST